MDCPKSQINCKKLIEFLGDYYDGSLPEEARAQFDEHIDLCGECKHYLDTYRNAIKLARDATDCDCSQLPEVPEQIVQGILKATTERD